MADPRNIVDFTEVQADYVTMIADGVTITYDSTKIRGSVAVDLAVTLSASKTVALAADGDPIFGKLVMVEPDGKCTVQNDGFATLPGGTAALLTPGLKYVGALGAAAAKGFIRGIAIATLADVAKGRGKIVDATDTTNVAVEL